MEIPMTSTMNVAPRQMQGLQILDRPAVSGQARLAGVGTAVTSESFSQAELLDMFQITDPKIRSVFLNSAIERRFLSIPERDDQGAVPDESQGELLAKHRLLAVEMGSAAIATCLEEAGAQPRDIEYLCCVTSTGFLTPGLSALIIAGMGLDPGCHRVDVVGMGCNAGLNALNGTAAWAATHPGRLAVMVCAEACSAAYVMDSTMRTAVVNSLFGNGAAAVALLSGSGDELPGSGDELPGSGDELPDSGGELPVRGGDGAAAQPGPRVLSFASHIITDAQAAMRYDWDDERSKFSFFLDPGVPYVVGAHAEGVIDRLLRSAGLRRGDVKHWLVHSGGKKVIDAVRVNLGLTRHDLRHTNEVLRHYGNVSSGSFLFSYQRLLAEGIAKAGDFGVLMTMGPGSTIETALIQW
jgi:predicted naringenin-chalcone synthase